MGPNPPPGECKMWCSDKITSFRHPDRHTHTHTRQKPIHPCYAGCNKWISTAEVHSLSPHQCFITASWVIWWTFGLKINLQFGRVVPGICVRTDRQTDNHTNRHAHHSTLLPYLGRVDSKYSEYRACSSASLRNRRFSRSITSDISLRLSAYLHKTPSTQIMSVGRIIWIMKHTEIILKYFKFGILKPIWH